MGVTLDPARAARLAYQLPRESRVWVCIATGGEDASHVWTPQYRLLAEVYNGISWLQWSRTKAAQDNPSSAPRPLLPPEARHKSDGGFTATADEYARIMRSIERNGKEVSVLKVSGGD